MMFFELFFDPHCTFGIITDPGHTFFPVPSSGLILHGSPF